jgi:hypothetical protein
VIIKNSSGTKLWVQYSKNLTNSDAYTVPIYIGETREIYITESMNPSTPASWPGNYELTILHISNDNGSPVNFDPNLEEHWVLTSSANRYDYLLTIDDNSF